MLPPTPLIMLNLPPSEVETIGGALGAGVALGVGLAAHAEAAALAARRVSNSAGTDVTAGRRLPLLA